MTTDLPASKLNKSSRPVCVSMSGTTNHTLVDSGVIEPLSAVMQLSTLIPSPPDKLKHNPTPRCGLVHKVSLLAESPSILGPYSLPTEILQMIFQSVFESCINLQGGFDVNGDEPSLWVDEDPLSPSLFPYALACVCSRWFHILRTTPVYWTRLVVMVDAIAASLQGTHTTLAWAGSRPLKVVIVRRRGASLIPDSERAAVSRAMGFLRPYVSRIWSLSFHLEHSSSIPALWRECRHASHLKVLTLRSQFGSTDIVQLSTWRYDENRQDYKAMYEAPLLREVTFSSHFLKNSLMADPRSKSWFRCLSSLTICGDAVTPSGNVVSLDKLMSVVTMLPIEKLTVEDIRFEAYAPRPIGFRPRSTVLRLCRVTGILALLGVLACARGRLQDLTIIDCPVHDFREPTSDLNLNFSSNHLTLASMDSIVKLEDVVYRWNGTRLSVIGCPKLSHTFLGGLHGEAAPGRLSHLHIVDCDYFSTRDLVLLVQSRRTQAAAVSLMGVPEDDDPFTAIVELVVQGCGPPIDVRQATWLAEHVERFSWDTIAKDGVQYVWDKSESRLTVTLVMHDA